MNVYSCCKCNMSVKCPTCAKCGCELKPSQIKVDNKDVQVCSCPSGCGKIKSPQCCGSDSVKCPTCAKCGCELKPSQIKVDNKDVQVCSCPSGCGKIKSPQCCGSDMEVSKCCDMKDKK